MKNIFKSMPKFKIPTTICKIIRSIFALIAGFLPIILYTLAIYFWQSYNIPITLNLTATTFLVFALSFFICGYFGTSKKSNDSTKSAILLAFLLWSALYATYFNFFGLLPKEISLTSLAMAIFFALAGQLSATRLQAKQSINDNTTNNDENLDINQTVTC